MMISVMILAVCCVAAMVAIIVLCKRKIRVVSGWDGAFRHTVALLATWTGFSFICVLFLVMSLFEADNFTLEGFLAALKVGISLQLAGLVVIYVILFAATRVFAARS